MLLAINLSQEQEEGHKGEENTEENDAEALEAYEVQDEATYHWSEGVAEGVRDVNDGVDAAVDFGVTGVDEIGDRWQDCGVQEAVAEADDGDGDHEDEVVGDEWDGDARDGFDGQAYHQKDVLVLGVSMNRAK